MVRLLYVLGGCALVGVCWVLGCWINDWNRPDPKGEALMEGPNVVERFKAAGENGPPEVRQVAPLIVAAKEFARCLNPPTPATSAVPEVPAATLSEPKPVIRPAFSAISFRLIATSYYEGRPDRSMALLSEMGGTDGGRWVREGTQVGHFTVHEIRQGMVVLRDGDSIRELTVERTSLRRNLVKEVRPGMGQAKALVVDSNN